MSTSIITCSPIKYVYLFPLTQTINSATSTNLLTYMKVSSHLSLSVLSCVHHVLCVLRALLPFLTSCLPYACALRALLAYRVFRALLTLVPCVPYMYYVSDEPYMPLLLASPRALHNLLVPHASGVLRDLLSWSCCH